MGHVTFIAESLIFCAIIGEYAYYCALLAQDGSNWCTYVAGSKVSMYELFYQPFQEVGSTEAE